MSGQPPPDIDVVRAHARHEHDDKPEPRCRVCVRFGYAAPPTTVCGICGAGYTPGCPACYADLTSRAERDS